MKRRSMALCILMTLLLTAFMVYMPGYLSRANRSKSYLRWLQKEPEPYTGVIRLWHIVGFKPYIGSLNGWLSTCAGLLEDQNFGVFILVEAVTAEEYALRRSRGERADVYSFPYGFLQPAQLQTLPASMLEECKEVIRPCAQRAGTYYAVPYTFSGYLLLSNTGLCQKQGVLLPQTLRESDGCLREAGDNQAFRDGKAALTVGDVRLCGEMSRTVQAGKGFAFEARAFTGRTDLIQYFGLDPEMENEKLPYAEEFIRIACGEKMQSALREIGLFPVAEGLEAYTYGAACLQALEEKLRTPVIPDRF